MPLANFNGDLSQIFKDFHAILKFGSIEVDCTESDVSQEMMIDISGVYDPKLKEVVTSYSDLQGLIPSAKDIVSLNGENYYVEKLQIDQQTDVAHFTIKRLS